MVTEPTHRRGDLWLVDVGHHPEDPEQAFHLPALIVSDDRLRHPALRMVVVVPGTTTIRGLPRHVVVEPDDDNGLDAMTAFQPEQVRAISATRLVTRLGGLDAVHRHTVDEILRNVLSLRWHTRRCPGHPDAPRPGAHEGHRAADRSGIGVDQ